MKSGMVRMLFLAGAAVVGTLMFEYGDKPQSNPSGRSAGGLLETGAKGGQSRQTQETQRALNDAYELQRNAARGDVDKVRKLLERGIPADARGERNRTALMYAAWNGQMAVCNLLFSYGASQRLQDYDGNRAIHYAAGRGQTETVNALLQQSQSEDKNHDREFAQLVYIAYTSDLDALARMPGKLSSINRVNPEDQTPLQIAAGNGYAPLVEALIERGADPAQPNRIRQTALHWAAWNQQLEVVKVLLAKGMRASPRSLGGGTPLMLAAQSNSNEVAKLLLEKGADPDLRDDEGRSAISIAESMGHRDMVALLRRYSKSR